MTNNTASFHNKTAGTKTPRAIKMWMQKSTIDQFVYLAQMHLTGTETPVSAAKKKKKKIHPPSEL